MHGSSFANFAKGMWVFFSIYHLRNLLLTSESYAVHYNKHGIHGVTWQDAVLLWSSDFVLRNILSNVIWEFQVINKPLAQCAKHSETTT